MSPLNKHLKVACWIFAILFFSTIPLVWLSLTAVNFHGDLTRIGKLSENDFSWQKHQAQVDESLRTPSPIHDADILVIGDSFSASLIWQTRLVKENKKVVTYHWDNTGLICTNFEEIISQSGFKGKEIIFQIIELGALDKIQKSLNCMNYKKQLDRPIEKVTPTQERPTISNKVNTSGQFIIGTQTLINSIALNNFPQSWQLLNKRTKSSKIFPVTNGCDLFSNKLCNLGLFYHQDYTKQPLNSTLISSMKVIESRLANYKITWLIIPNKSTVYHRYESDDFWTQLEKENMGPNILKDFLETKNKIMDFYLPNDTHLSTAGYLHLGEIITKQKIH
jgi:hypothetical protein